jgi:zinc-ribbon domain
MKECPKCYREVDDIHNFCPNCGSPVSTANADAAIVTAAPNAVKEYGEASKDITSLNQDEDALIFVYISQCARSDGTERAGVLVDDCKSYFKGIFHLLDQGYVREETWYKLRGYVTTTEGSRRASLIIQRHWAENKDTLTNMLDSLPPRFLHFILEEVIKGVNRAGRSVDITGITFTGEEADVHLCLLNDKQVKKLLDKIMKVLIQKGFATTAHDYASSHQGRVDEMVYCFAPEVAGFFDKYLISTSKFVVGSLFDKNLESKHQLYHQLGDGITFGKNYLDKAALDQLRMIRGTLRVELINVFRNLYDLKIVTVDPSRVFIQNPEAYQKITHQAFLAPLVDYLLSPITDNNGKIAGPAVSDDNSPNSTKLIGNSQVDLLFGE